jgi:hypothetical protein
MFTVATIMEVLQNTRLAFHGKAASQACCREGPGGRVMFAPDHRLKSCRFQIKDEIKAARIEATKAYILYVEELKTSQR